MLYTLPLTIYFAILSSLSWLEEVPHKFYVSTTLIEFNSQANTLEIVSQVFTDDLEVILTSKDPQLTLDPDSDQTRVDELIADYFKQVLQVSVKESRLDQVFLGKEYKNDITQCYIEIQLEEVPDTIELFNGLFFSLFDEQQNIIHFKHADQRKSYLLHKKNPRVALSITN